MAEDSNPPVTVLMPVYNGQRYIAEAIESILAQTYREFELLIINDGSTDQSKEIITSFKDPRIRYEENENNLGLIATLNRGLALASHELVARHDADDISEPDRLARQVSAFCADPRLSLVGTQASAIDENGKKVSGVIFERPRGKLAIRWFALFDNPFIHGSVMFKRSVVLDALGGYGDFYLCEDYELWSRLLERFEGENIGRLLIRHRIHSASQIGSLKQSGADDRHKKAGEGNQKIIKRNLDHLFGSGVFTDENAITLRMFVSPIDKTGLCRSFMILFENVLEQYMRCYPDAREDRWFKRTVALQLAKVAYDMAPFLRSEPVRLYRKAIGVSPGIIFSLPWAKIAALLLFGETSRRILRKITGRGAA